jgi:hypothetical protein
MRWLESLGSVCALALAMAPARLAGQPLYSGQLVRLSAPGAGFVRDTARVMSVAADTLVVGRLAYRAHDPVPLLDTVRSAVALSEVRKLEVRQRTPGFTALGLLLGLVGGASGGAALGRSSGDSPCGWWFIVCQKVTAGDKETIYGIVGASLGAGLGAFIGSRIGRERWKAVPLEGLRVGAFPLPSGRVGIGAAMAF